MGGAEVPPASVARSELQLVGDRDAARLGGMLELPVTSTSGMQFPSIILQHVADAVSCDRAVHAHAGDELLVIMVVERTPVSSSRGKVGGNS
jgi:hypothetical protein